MREHPIIFSGPMVRAILEGRKTQTRRIVKLKPGQSIDNGEVFSARDPYMIDPGPYGGPGDRLWVRESFYTTPCKSEVLGYSADGDHPHGATYRHLPSIHMPRALSRIVLEITGVRVERLQDISEEDARAEGVESMRVRSVYPSSAAAGVFRYREGFERVWKSIHGADSWVANPWVRVIEFKPWQRQGRPR